LTCQGWAGSATALAIDWPVVLAAVGVQALILNNHLDAQLGAQVRAHPEWVLDFEDSETALFVRAGE
jgi:hypothetical protein